MMELDTMFVVLNHESLWVGLISVGLWSNSSYSKGYKRSVII